MTEPRNESRLTPKQARFVDEYMVDLNATQAAIRAGYSARTARSVGAENLTKPDIQDAIAAAKRARSERTGITADRVLEELASIGFSSIEDYRVDEHGRFQLADSASASALRAVSRLKEKTRTFEMGEATVIQREVEYHLWDKISALFKLGQHLGMFGEDRAPQQALIIRVVRE